MSREREAMFTRSTRALALIVSIFAIGERTMDAAAAVPRLTLPADPAPDLPALAPAIRALACPNASAACGRAAADVLERARKEVERSANEAEIMAALCARQAGTSLTYEEGLATLRTCLAERRAHKLWLPARAFQLPRDGWLVFHA